ncbi:MAG TPA: patatin-like phospholipase family protein [Xanthobacteraceae bacterium]|nr:patatin-like phospholipase family protein [Xanthobacteraceae bacterium]
MSDAVTSEVRCPAPPDVSGYGEIVLVFQGGGALGAYQAGVYQALHEAGIEPDWIIGTSIGAVNAALIAGNAADDRLPRLQEFWRRLQRPPSWAAPSIWPGTADAQSQWMTLLGGVPAFFKPNPLAFLGSHVRLGADRAGYYSTEPLRENLLDLVDPGRLNRGKPRLTVGAAHVRTGQMRYFDSRDGEITINHIMASAAVPPAFPPIRIDGELYWDGGILSNTPTEAVFDDKPRRSSLIFAVQVWNPTGPEPDTMSDVLHRQKDIQFSSRVAGQIARQRQIHRLRHVIGELVRHLPEAERQSPKVRELASYGCLTRMHVVHLLAQRLDNENHAKDLDFTPAGISGRWEAGYTAARQAIESRPWEQECDPIEGVILHERMPAMPLAAE